MGCVWELVVRATAKLLDFFLILDFSPYRSDPRPEDRSYWCYFFSCWLCVLFISGDRDGVRHLWPRVRHCDGRAGVPQNDAGTAGPDSAATAGLYDGKSIMCDVHEKKRAMIPSPNSVVKFLVDTNLDGRLCLVLGFVWMGTRITNTQTVLL